VAALTPPFFDMSVLVAGLMEIGKTSEYPQRIMTAIAAGQIRRATTAWHCCLEFYSVATRLTRLPRRPTAAILIRHPPARIAHRGGVLMGVQQSIAVPKGRDAGLGYLWRDVEDATASGLIARAIEQTGAHGVSAAPPAQ
jgi:polar amino acid transport system substrate-binding protein